MFYSWLPGSVRPVSLAAKPEGVYTRTLSGELAVQLVGQVSFGEFAARKLPALRRSPLYFLKTRKERSPCQHSPLLDSSL